MIILKRTRSAWLNTFFEKSHNVHIHTHAPSHTLAAKHYTATYNTTHFGWHDDTICLAAKGSPE